MDRISTYGQHQRTLTYMNLTQTHMADLQNQISSGRKSMRYEGISRDAERLVSVESMRTRVTQYVQDNQLAERRLTTMETNVSQVFELMSEFKTLLVDALNAQNAQDLDLANQSQQILNQVAALLNVQEDGRYLFAGYRTDTAPVNMAVPPMPVQYTIPTSDPAAGTTPAYYRGTSDKLSVRAEDNFDVTYGVTADEQGFERAIRALDIVIKSPQPTDTTMLQHVLGVTSNAITDIADIRTGIGVATKTLGDVRQRHSDTLLFAEETINDIENVDVADAVTRMNNAQTTLEASYMTISRLSQLTLLNFIR